jgi:hypothetical protein
MFVSLKITNDILLPGKTIKMNIAINRNMKSKLAGTILQNSHTELENRFIFVG